MNSALRASVSLLTFCLCVGLLAPAGGAPSVQSSDGQSTIAPVANGTNYLSPSDPAVEEYQGVGVDVTSAASIGAQKLHSEYDRRRNAEQLDISNATRREEIATVQIDRIEERFETIARQQAQLYESYANNEISARLLLRNVAILQVVAETQVENYEQAAAQTELSIERLSQLETFASGLTPKQPIVDQVTEMARTAESTTPVYLQAGSGGLVIAAVVDERFVRQAMVLGERDFDGKDQFKLAQDISIEDEEWATPVGYEGALSRFAELYPWAYDITTTGTAGQPNLFSRIYGVEDTNPQGRITAYFDSATKNVFHENQYGFVSDYSIEETVTNSTDAGTVTLRLTHESGPLQVTVTDGSREMTDVAIKINDQQIGSTDEDGNLWTVQPLAPFEVTVTTPDGERITVAVP